MSATIAKLDKNSAEEIRFSFAEWNGKRYLPVQVAEKTTSKRTGSDGKEYPASRTKDSPETEEENNEETKEEHRKAGPPCDGPGREKMNVLTITEDSSEKRKRGRPRIHPIEMVRHVLKTEDAKTERGAVEYLLTASTIVSIVDAWKADPSGATWAEYYAGKDVKNPRIFHHSILAALGRIENEEERLASARIIAEKKLSTRCAVAAIRRSRLGREDKPDFLTLVGSIETALSAYLAAHPSTPTGMIIRALRELAETYEEGETS